MEFQKNIIQKWRDSRWLALNLRLKNDVYL